MPRPILNRTEQTVSSQRLSLTAPSSDTQSAVSQMEQARLLRRKRSAEYVNMMQKLDSGGAVHNEQQVKKIIDAIKLEIPEIDLPGILLGIVSICYLGHPYEVHTLDMTGGIIEHYKVSETLPGGMEKARSLALHGGYAFIEVYADCCRAVDTYGNVSVVND